jgi:hypothetical protein
MGVWGGHRAVAAPDLEGVKMNGNTIWYWTIALMLAVFIVGLLSPTDKRTRRHHKHKKSHA